MHKVTVADDDLIPGLIYTFRWYAINAFGSGQLSNEITVALAAFPVATTAITKNMATSSNTSISVSWNPVTSGASPGGDILGYALQVVDSLNGSSWTAFNGTPLGIRTQTKFNVRNLVPGRLYIFTVTAYNFNGAGATSVQ